MKNKLKRKPEIRAKKNLGQHFLSDQSIITEIVNSINPNEQDNFLEIGPGLGAITIDVLEISKKLTVIELDRRVIPVLKVKSKLVGDLEIIQQDILTVDFDEVLAGKQWKIFGNLPYNISTPILFSLNNIKNISEMTFMLQKEVIDRMEAMPGDKAYGRLSIMLQQTHDIFALFDVPPESFSPPPKVMSAMVKMVTRDEVQWAVSSNERFYDVVKMAFSMRRKTLRNTMKSVLTSEEIESLGIDSGLRAEKITGQQFADISNYLEARL